MHLVILLFGMFASLFTLQKGTLSVSEPFFLVGSRMFMAGLIMLSYLIINNKKEIHKVRLAHFGLILSLALTNIYLTNIFEIWAIKNMVSSKACLFYSLSPFVAALVSYFVLQEKLTPKKMAGMLVGFLGLLPIIYTQTETEIMAGKFLVFSLAEMSIIGAVFCSVLGWILLKKVLIDFAYSPVLANGISMLLGGSLALVHSYLAGENWAPIPVTNMPRFLFNSATMLLLSNLICYNLYGYLLQRFSATFMSFAGLITPIFASIFGYLFLQETITWHFFVSMIFFLIGLMLYYKEELTQTSPSLSTNTD